MIGSSTTTERNDNRAITPLPPRAELDMAQSVRLTAARRLFAQATPPSRRPTDLDILANRVFDTFEDDYVHIPANFAEGIPLTGPAATPRLRALWNSFWGLMHEIRQQYDVPGVRVENYNTALDLLTNGTQRLADRFLEFMRLAANLTAQEAQTVVDNLPAALELVSERLPSRAALGDALTDVRGRLPAPAQQALDTFVQAAPAVLAVAGIFSTRALMAQLAIEMLPATPRATGVEEADDNAEEAPEVPPPATLISRITYTIRQTLGTDRAFFVFLTLAFSLCIAALVKIKIDESRQLSEYCSTTTVDARPFYDIWSNEPQSYEACMANGWPKV